MKKEYNLSQKKISGWGNTNFSYSTIVRPETTEAILAIIQKAVQSGKKIIPRGAGRSYGDQSLNDGQIVVDMNKMNQIVTWDKVTGHLQVEAGATYEEVLIHCLKDNWLLPTVPGTRYVTMGGALANNIHGKNSYNRGNFGEGVQEFKIILASGEVEVCSKEKNRDLFFATIGGAGLLGFVTEMTLQLIPIPSPYLSVIKSTASNLNELLEHLDEATLKNDFAIAQVDCFPKGHELGRGTIHAGNFLSNTKSETKNIETIRNISPKMFGLFPKKWIPRVGRYILNDYTMRWISGLKYHLDKKTSSKDSHLEDFFQFTFLLDGIPNWKNIFRYGFFEYEPLIPRDKAKAVIPELIKLTHKYAMPAYLSAIKVHRKDNFLLSYSMDGYSFAMDLPRRPKEKEKQNELFREMNKVVIGVGGIVYLAKDACLTRDEFRQMYKNIEQFLALKKKYDPSELFQSDMYRRIFK